MSRRIQVLLVTAVAVFMTFLDVTIVNIAFPDIRSSFPDSSLPQLSWIIDGYAIVFAAGLIPAGRLADRFGRRRFFMIGTLVFLVASAACGFAQTPDMLIASRVVQALGGAMVVPASLGLLLPEFPLEKRATATALWGATGGVAAATGPSLGGVLVDWQGWRAVFFVNLFIGLPALLIARRILVEHREPDVAVPDLLGAAFLGIGVGALVLAIVEGSTWGWASTRDLVAFATFLVFATAFVWRAAKHPAPIVELSLFRVRSFVVANIGSFLFSLGFYALLLSNVLFLTGVWHYSVFRAGVALTPGPLMAASWSVVGGRLSDRFGQRPIAVPGGLIFATGALLFALRLGVEREYWTGFFPATILTGTGVGLSFAAFSSAAVAELPRNRFATGGAVNNCVRQIGAAVGIAVLVAVVGTPSAATAVHVFHRAWVLMALTGLAAGLVGLALGRVRARDGVGAGALPVAPVASR